MKQAFTLHLITVSFWDAYSDSSVTQKPAKDPSVEEYSIGVLSCARRWMKEPSGLVLNSINYVSSSDPVYVKVKAGYILTSSVKG